MSPVRRALLGLTLDEAGYALRRAVMATGGFGRRGAARAARREAPVGQPQRRHRIHRRRHHLGEVGGLEGLKKWLIERRKLFEMRDSAQRRNRAQGTAA